MPDKDNNILEYISEEKSLKVPFIIYADLEYLLKKINICSNNPKKSYTEKKAVHKFSGYSLVKCCSFDKSKNERKYYRGEDNMKIFCKDLKELAMKIINYEKKEMIPLTDKEKEAHKNSEVCNICEKEFCIDEYNKSEFKKKQKVRDHCHYTGKYRGAAHSICNLRYTIPKTIPVVFHNGSIYDYHFIIKQLARTFQYYLECLGENSEKYITFSVPIKKVLVNDNNNDSDNDSDNDIDNDSDNDSNNDSDNDKKNCKDKKAKTITYRLRFIESCRFMQDSLSNLVDNLFEINNKEPKNEFTDGMRSMTISRSQSIDKVSKIDKKISQNKFIDNMRSMVFSLTQSINKISEIDKKISQTDKKELDHTFTDSIRSVIDSLSQSINRISKIDNKISEIDNKFTDNTRPMISSLLQSIDKVSDIDNKISYSALIENFHNKYLLCNNDLNKFALLLRKGVYPYEYMDNWERFKEKLLPDKEYFYSELNKEHITVEDYTHAQKVWNIFNIKS